MNVRSFWLVIIFLGSFFSTSSRGSIIYTDSPFSAVDSNGLSPYWKWKTIESDHFRVTFPEELHDAAVKTMNHFEEAHSFLSPLLHWEPHEKTQVLAIDNADIENGLTSPVARYGIVLWITPPDYWYGSSYYDDWLRLVVIHEYTHFLNMDTTYGVWDPLRYVFGDSLLPNSLWPPWMLEGLAVYMETRFTTAGRGRSPYYEMVLRGAVEDGKLNSPEFITLDKINGTNPYFPGGDTRYLFGYNLMNQVAQSPSSVRASQSRSFPIQSSTQDSTHSTTHSDDVLGIMSKNSGKRFPFFINGNLKHITGRTWHDFWNSWVEQTQDRISTELKKIKSQPVSQVTLLTEKNHLISNDITGVAASPDGKWLAYTLTSTDRRQGLYLMNRETRQSTRLMDKLLGIGLCFTPDSKAILFSRLHQIGQYYRYSDLEIYDLTTSSSRWLTENQRTRDPHISPDGKWVTFTLTENTATGLAIAPLNQEGGAYHLGAIQKLYMPPKLDRVGNPQFSRDGKKIFFAYHPNGKTQEDIVEFNRDTQITTTLVSNGKFNRFPIVSKPIVNEAVGSRPDRIEQSRVEPSRTEEELFFVSDLTGADNLYRYEGPGKKPSLVTNLTTGLNYPSFGPSVGHRQSLYAGVFSYTGWNLAEVQMLKHPIAPESVTLTPPPAPEIQAHSVPDQKSHDYRESDYSVLPSILPRLWSPLLGIEANGLSAGAEVFGFDAINVHRYLFAGSYNTNLAVADWHAIYSNRTLGPALNLQADLLTDYIQLFPASASYARELNLSASAAYPILWTYSSLTPSLAINLDKFNYYQTSSNFSESSLTKISPVVPSIDGVLTFSNLEVSSLAIGPEAGRVTQLGTRVYLNGTDQIWKALLMDKEYIRLGQHSILSPSVKGTWVSSTSLNYPAANAYLEGRTLQTLVNPFPSDNFNQLSIRGYPNTLFPASKLAGVTALDLRFPILRIFRGAGTHPLFLDNLYGTAFAETSFFPYGSSGYFLPSAGAGLRLSSEVLFLPLTFSAEYHQGFRTDLGGASDFFFQILASAIQF